MKGKDIVIDKRGNIIVEAIRVNESESLDYHFSVKLRQDIVNVINFLEEKLIRDIVYDIIHREPIADDYKLLTRQFRVGDPFRYSLFFNEDFIGEVDLKIDINFPENSKISFNWPKAFIKKNLV